MLKREIFVDAISKIKKHEELMDRLDTVCREFGSFRPSLDFGNLHLQALLEVLKDAMDDEYDYISWWLYDAAPDYEVWTDDEKTKWCLKEPEALYDFIRDECQG